ncbi:MAG: class II aldolase/adducin family protein [Ichthyobacteriaceae bacterium]|nr:class II aldolase/adducin family protein [Ichthyobacteriaceae bacterium]
MKIDINTIHPKELIAFMLEKVYKAGNTTTSGGNISVRDEKGDVWITPSSVDKGRLTHKDISCIKADGSITGLHNPSSEYPFHVGVYEKRDDLNAVIHAHSPALVAFSIVGKIPNTKITPYVNAICEEMGFADYRVPGSQDLGDVIAEEFAKGFNAVIMENHGVVIAGKDMMEAYNRFETLELLAQTLINASEFGTPYQLSDKDIENYNVAAANIMNKNTEVLYSSEEKEIRTEIVDFMNRSTLQKLMYSSVGSISVRIADDKFVTTPGDKLRWNLSADDLIQVDGDKIENGVANNHVALDKEIFDTNKDVNAIVHTSSPNLMAFSVIHKNLDVRTIPESWIFLQDILNVKYGDQFAGSTEIANKLTLGSPLAVIENDSVLAIGKDLTTAFDRLEIGEFSAKSLIMGNKLGDFKPMSETDVEDLRVAFLS